MKRMKLSFATGKLSQSDLEDVSESAYSEPSARQQKANIRRWRRLKHQLI